MIILFCDLSSIRVVEILFCLDKIIYKTLDDLYHETFLTNVLFIKPDSIS